MATKIAGGVDPVKHPEAWSSGANIRRGMINLRIFPITLHILMGNYSFFYEAI